MTAIAVFCASRPVPQEYIDLATEVGRGIAAGGDSLVWGGGHVSMMGAVAQAASGTRRARCSPDTGIVATVLVR